MVVFFGRSGCFLFDSWFILCLFFLFFVIVGWFGGVFFLRDVMFVFDEEVIVEEVVVVLFNLEVSLCCVCCFVVGIVWVVVVWG